jgi:flagellar FliL protein
MKKVLVKSIMLLGVFLIGSGAGAGAMFAFGKLAPTEQEEKAKSEKKGAHGEKKQPEKKNIQIVQFQKEFTSNLLENGRFLQVSISMGLVSTEQKEVEIKEYEAQLRSSILTVLAEQSGAYMATASGKRHLQSELKNALNTAFEAINGDSPVDNVYFTSFIVQ